MNFHFPWFTKPKSQPLRSVVAYRTESLAVTLRKQQQTAKLQRVTADLTPEERKAAIERATIRPVYEVVRSATAYDKSLAVRLEPKIFAGMR